VSQSRSGLHLVLKGINPGTRTVGQLAGCKVELLANHCVTLTGCVFQNFDTLRENPDDLQKFYGEIFPPVEKSSDSPLRKSPPLSNDEVITLLNKAANFALFKKLFYDGDISDYDEDESRADQALANLIAFYVQKPEQIFDIFKESALYKLPGGPESTT
jgi:primase-polymerase (primpol)-like protein